MDNPPLTDWLQSLAAKQPTPGGGAVAGLLAATAAALTSMVSIYTTGPKWADRTEQMQAMNSQAIGLRLQALKLMDDDAQAFQAVGQAYQSPKATDEEVTTRAKAIQVALRGAAQPPINVINLCLELVPVLEDLADTANPNLISDVAVAASCLRAALESAIVNVAINQSLLADKVTKQTLQASIDVAQAAIKKTDAITMLVYQKIAH